MGKRPGNILFLYTGNDLNDDFIFPHRTVLDGYLVARERSVNLLTGEKTFYSDSELQARLDDRLRPLRSRQVLDALGRTAIHQRYSAAKRGLRARIDAAGHPARAGRAALPAMPTSAATAYAVNLSSYLHTYDRPWYNELVEQHKNTIREFADYAALLDTRFLLVDADGTLQHARLLEVVEELQKRDGAFYYDLSQESPPPTRLPDGHWDVAGNQTAGRYIYERFRRQGVFQ
ncbi:MAG: hypothetical protein ACT4QD_21685 [Acidobacteriota bacterium]